MLKNRFKRTCVVPTYHFKYMKDLTDTIDISRVTGKGNICKTYHAKNKKQLVNLIVYKLLNLILDDIIETGDIVYLPTRNPNAFKIVKKHVGEIERIMEMDKFKGIDYFFSDYNIYQYVYLSKRGNEYKYKYVKIDHDRWHKLVTKVNEGKRY